MFYNAVQNIYCYYVDSIFETYAKHKNLSLEEMLIDFNYNINSDGTYTITSWKGTYFGAPTNSTFFIPDDNRVKVEGII